MYLNDKKEIYVAFCNMRYISDKMQHYDINIFFLLNYYSNFKCMIYGLYVWFMLIDANMYNKEISFVC